jgi:hypothetical protein
VAVTIDNIRVEFYASPQPLITFLQGRDMSVPTIRDTLREIEETIEGRHHSGSVSGAPRNTGRGWICEATGNITTPADELIALSVILNVPFQAQFEAGAIPFISKDGNLYGDLLDSPGAIVVINNSVGLLGSSEIEQIKNVVEADQVKGSGQLQTRLRGTTTELIPRKDVTGDSGPANVTITEP